MTYLKAKRHCFTIYIRCKDLESEELIGYYLTRKGYEITSVNKTAYYSGKRRHGWIELSYSDYMRIGTELDRYSIVSSYIKDIMDLHY